MATRKQEKVLREAIALVILNPKLHNQNVWTCGGGAACLAGHIALQNGWVPVKQDEKSYAKAAKCDPGDYGIESGPLCGWDFDSAVASGALVQKGRKVATVQDVAAKLIGIERKEGQRIEMFDAYNTASDIVRLAEEYLSGESAGVIED